jgi:peptide chain release factor subunit 1
VRQLESVVSNNRRFGLLLVDRQRARMFVFELGELLDRSEVFDQLPRHEDDRGDWDKDHVRDHSADVAQHHFKRAAEVAFEVYKAQPFDHLVIGGPDEVVIAFERHLHSYLKDRLAARINLPVASSDSAIREAALAVEQQVERAHEAALVERLREAVGGGSAVAGLVDTLRALVERRVDTLLVSDGFEAPGWRCHGCGHVATLGRRCPLCSTDMHEIDDVVEEAIEAALNQSCHVEVCVGNADLDVLGRVGALLRF